MIKAFLVRKQKGSYKHMSKWKHLGHEKLFDNLQSVKYLPSPKCYSCALLYSAGFWANLLTAVTVKPGIWSKDGLPVVASMLMSCQMLLVGCWLWCIRMPWGREALIIFMILSSLKACYWSLVTPLWKVIIHKCNVLGACICQALSHWKGT